MGKEKFESEGNVDKKLRKKVEKVKEVKEMVEKKAEETINLLNGNEEQMWFEKNKDKLEEAKAIVEASEKKKLSKEEKQNSKKLELVHNLSPKEIKELIEYVSLNKKREVRKNIGEPGHLKFALIGDTHIGAKGCALDELHQFYKDAKDMGAECVLHAGDVVDGCGVYHGQRFEQSEIGYEDQLKKVVEDYPDVGLKTYFIGGNHDESYIKGAGANIAKSIGMLRDDMEYLGMYQAKLRLNGIDIELQHGGGGTSYSQDYKLLKYLDKIKSGQEPDIYGLGHYHQAIHSLHRGIHGFMPGAFLKENLLAKRFGFPNVIGGWIIEVDKDREGKLKLTTTFLDE